MRIAHNPETGEYIGLQDGEWKPLRIAQNDAGERVYLDGDSWQHLPGWQARPQGAAAPLAVPSGEGPREAGERGRPSSPSPSSLPSAPAEKLDLGDAYENLGIDPEDVPDISGSAGYVSETMSNVPRSAMDLARGLGQVFLHPGQTIDNLGNVVLGYKEKGAKLLNPEEAPGEHEKYADAMNQMVADRYGSLDKAAKTFREDPLGVGLDASMLLGGGGALLKGAGAAGKAAGAANVGGKVAKAGEALTKAGQIADPLTTLSYLARPVTAPIGAAVGKAAEFISPEAIYARAAKMPPRSMTKGNRDLAIEAAIRERIPISAQGIEKAQEKIRSLGKEVQNELARPEHAAKRIDPLAIAIDAEDRAMSMFANQARPQADLRAIRDVTDDFLDAHPHPMTLKEAHDVKQGTQQAQSKRAYEERKGAAVEAEKAYSRALNDAIYSQAPEVRALNKRLQGLIELAKELPKATNRVGNHSFINLAGAQGAGGYLGHAVAGPMGAVAGAALAKALSSPRVQSEIAFALDAARKGYRASAPVRRWMKKAGIPAKYGAYVEARYGGLIGELERSK